MKRPARFALVAMLLMGSLTGRAADKPGNSTDFTAKRTEQFSAWQRARKLGDHPGDVWDCAACPVLKVLPTGRIYVGSADWEHDREANEGPLAEVQIPANIAVGRFEVTRGEFAAFATATHRRPRGKCQSAGPRATFLDAGFPQSDDHPVVCVSFEDARAYIAWLNTQSDGGYRLLTEAEWEFATRTATHTKYAWGNEAAFACLYANHDDDDSRCEDPWSQTAPVGSSAINGYDLYDLSGNASEWVEGCFVPARQPAALDTSCPLHIEKGGSWKSTVRELRPARRAGHEAKYREDSLGFRVAKNLPGSSSPLASAADYQRRGRMLASVQAYAEARADFERALALEPRNALLLAERAETSYWLGDTQHCHEDVSAALAIDADEPLAITLQAALRRAGGPDAKGGLEGLERAAKLAPWRAFTQSELALARYASGDVDGALASSAAALALAPRYQPVFELRLHILVERRNWRGLYSEARQMVIASYFNDQMHADAALAYSRLGIPEAAVWAMTRAIEIRPIANYYVMRETVRRREDLEGRRADLMEALKIEPALPRALYLLARVESDAGNHAAAALAFTEVIKSESQPRRVAQARLMRGIEYAQSGSRPLAEKDFAAWLETPNDAGNLNEMCWYLTVAGVELERAQRSCKRALELKPRNAAYLDSQGWLLLRLERFDEAIVAFDAALKERPDQAASLFGRGLARQQKCGCREGGKDLLAALAADPASVQKFAFTGHTPRGELIAPWLSQDSKRGVAPTPP